MSRTFRFEREAPIHRYDVQRFFETHSSQIRGSCFEFHDSGHLRTYGEGRPSWIDVLDLSEKNPHPAFMRELHRLRAFGDTLLVAVPVTSMIDPNWTEYRRWTALGLRRLLGQFFRPSDIRGAPDGNSLAAAAETRGLPSDAIAPWS